MSSNTSSPIIQKISDNNEQYILEELLNINYNIDKLIQTLLNNNKSKRYEKIENIIYNKYKISKITELKEHINLNYKNCNNDNCSYTIIEEFFNCLFNVFVSENKNKLDFNAVNSDNKTLLMQSIFNKNAFYTEELIINGANVNKKGSNGWTPLLQAVVLINTEDIIKLLLSNGSDIFHVNNNNQNCLHMIAGKDRVENLSVILEYINSELIYENLKNSNNNIILEINTKLLNLKDHIGMTPFVKSCASGSFYFANHLLNSKYIKNNCVKFDENICIDINSQDKEGNTALHYCFEFGNEEFISKLIEKEIKPIKNNKNQYCFELTDNNIIKEKFLDYIKKTKSDNNIK